MSPIENIPESVHGTEQFRPAFCQRADCKADSNAPYCATCGADIAGYATAMTAAHEPVGVTQDGTIIQAPASGSGPAIRVEEVPGAVAVPPVAEASTDPAFPERGPLWRDGALWAAFGACGTLGAAAALLAQLA